MEHLRLEEDVPREVRGQPQVELSVVQREGAADREQVGSPQRILLQLGQQCRQRRLQQLRAACGGVVCGAGGACRELAWLGLGLGLWFGFGFGLGSG